MVTFIYKGIRKIKRILLSYFHTPYAKLVFYLNGVKFSNNLSVRGIVKIFVTRRGKVIIGKNLSINSGFNHNIIGRQQKTIFWVEGKLIIGNNVGMSSTAIVCNHEIEIGNDVTIGGNTVIYDTDFHTLDATLRMDKSKDKLYAKWGKVRIKDSVFIGAHTTILKGVTIGENSIVGACSVITKDIPSNEIWAGNPAQFIKKGK
ncbi:acyltransferase [Lutibacter citreus]|uniref:acyltransferase n=1 Tax=Lutibacter citreus TaxID=2138210 RepID=UPI000DBE413C|nr:acyltransferase [Lutibacter citreus]